MSVTTNEEAQPIDFEGFAPITTTDGIGGGAKSDEVALEVTKKLEGKTLEKDAFSFQLLDDKGNVLQTVKNDENGKVKFEAIKYKEAGTFKYTIKEVNDNKPGYTYDANVLKATVTVEDVLGEKLASVKFEDSKKEFTNTYAAKEAKLQLEAKKVLNGKALEAGQFEFELKEDGKVLHTVSNDANGKIQFPELTLTEEKTYTYTISEKAGDVAGVEYDPNAYEVNVVVKDNGQGQLVATPDAENITFTNVYKAKPAKATITATKVLNGKELEADKYEFELKEGDKVVATAKNAADGTVTFPVISYDAAGPHTYTITEKAGSEKGVTYDESTHKVTVNVTDNGQGQLVATVPDNNPTFTNTYKAAETKATITATKVLNGKALEADKYEFELKEGDKVVATAKNAADGTVTFPAISYDAAGPHTYTITEKAGSEKGVTYDESTHTVTVNVTDNGEGKLVADVKDNNPTFTNTYKATPAKEIITATKVLNGKELEAGKYEFELKKGEEVVATATNAADGTVTFKEIEFNEAGDYTYTISEKVGSEAGVTYDESTHKVTVKVTDNGAGQLVATATNNNPTFTNTYKAKPAKPIIITATKVLNGKALEAGKYEFELKEGDKVVDTATNAADGTVTFEAIEYTAAGEHTYTISEKAGSEGGVTYDTAKHEVKVAVVDNGAGELVATVTDNNPTFTNTYKAASTTVNITAKKVLNGKALEAGKYEFELKEGDKVIGTATNAVDGTVAFAGIEYKEAGEHTYTISEKAGSEAGVTYDTATHKVTVKVVDNGAGKLVATVTDNNPTFTNTYVASSTQVTFTAKKVLNGNKLAAGQFEFELREGDKLIETVKNAADGTVTFKAKDFAKAGVYTYTITEVKGNEEGVTYDPTVHNVTVEVVDNGAGQLVTTVTGNNPTITNTYTEPKKEEPKEDPKGEQPKKDLPNTGGADFTAFSTILGLVLAALAGLVYRAKKVD